MQSGCGECDYSDADDSTIKESVAAAAEQDVPSDIAVDSMIDDLQAAVEIWLKPGGKESEGGEAEFLYDESWGGFVNCGCNYTFEEGHAGEGFCSNTFPECPAIDSVNEDFGNAWYNDHHFHYGYMIYAAAIVAKHRPEWGREYYDRILLYIRDIANPSADDSFFPMYRQKGIKINIVFYSNIYRISSDLRSLSLRLVFRQFLGCWIDVIGAQPSWKGTREFF